MMNELQKRPRLGRRRGWRRALMTGGAAAIFLGVPGLLAAQQTGVVTGTVVDGGTNQPLAGVQITVTGTSLGGLSNNSGAFRIASVPAGEHEVVAQRIGYQRVVESVTVPAGGSVTVSFRLEESAITLDEVVVTGRAAATARREIGTSIAGINVEDMEAAPVSSMSELLQGRAPGVTIVPTGGQAGQGSRILLRGMASISQANTPVVYVDGVRMDNSSYAGIRTTGPTWSGFDDINPDDIQSIEVIRGASAATLYGTEAAAGVIAITTKRGAAGETQYTVRSEYGQNSTPRSWWRESTSVYADWLYDTLIDDGTYHSNQVSVSGGQERFNYYFSGTLRHNGGIQPNSHEDYGAFRSNFQIRPADNLTLGVNAGYTQREVMVPPNANNQEGFINNGLVGGPGGNWNPPENLVALEMFQNGDRFTGSVNGELRTGPFVHRLTLGADVFASDNTEFLPPDVVPRYSGGYKGAYRRHAKNFNLDAATTFRTQLTDGIRSTTSAGFQAFRSESGITTGYGEEFPFLGLRVISATASGYSVGESRSEERSAGFFGEQQFAVNETFFLTLGARADGHSAFGSEVDYQIYPKADASYVVSQHDFWDDAWGSLRLRGAYGTAGMQPAAFSAVRTWTPTSAAGGLPAIVPSNVGNPDLKPEVSHELELGFDAGLLDERVNVEFTYYNQRTEDALYQARNIESLGFLGTQLRNIGEVRNSGIELGTTFAVLDLPSVRWDLRANYSTNENEVVSLGGEPANNIRWAQYVREGFPLGAFFAENHIMEVDGQAVNKYDLLGEGPGTLTLEEQYIGSPTPTQTFQLGSDVAFLDDFNFSFLLDYQGGHYRHDHTLRWLMDPRRAVTDDQGTGVGPGALSTRCREAAPGSADEVICGRNSLLSHGEFIVPADFWKLREVSLTYQVPSSLAGRIGASGATLSLAGRNLWRWMETPSLEPESNLNAQSTLQRNSYFDTPVPRQFVAGVTLRF
ncbi:MAG TPA: TonB-dependent receptor [Longimicrobiales bacterium]|nr:TonB-dependent receptor [Longimicrobiales bacterium]